jgi:dephospho-CoA kinase
MGSTRWCIAGYMGAGKTTVAKRIAAGTLHVIDADREAKIMMTSDPDLTERLVKVFGSSILEKKTLSFSRLGAIAFSAREQLLRLNEIVHPPLIQRLRKIVESGGDSGCILDAALAPLWKIESWFSTCIWVNADHAMRLHRIALKSPELDETHIRKRMNLQEDTVPFPAFPPWIRLDNSGSMEELDKALERSGFLRD